MPKRTTIEIDEALLRRAKQALGQGTTRATVEEALRLAADGVEAAGASRATAQHAFLEGLAARIDIDVLASEDMWR